MGQYLLATALRRRDERQASLAALKRTGWVHSDVVTQSAFDLVVRRLFQPGTDVRQIALFVADMQDRFGDDIKVLEGEALIRRALGENTPVHDVDDWTATGIHITTITTFADLCVLGGSDAEAELRDILDKAERVAFERGFHPTLAR
jgi:hypothetical protein